MDPWEQSFPRVFCFCRSRQSEDECWRMTSATYDPKSAGELMADPACSLFHWSRNQSFSFSQFLSGHHAAVSPVAGCARCDQRRCRNRRRPRHPSPSDQKACVLGFDCPAHLRLSREHSSDLDRDGDCRPRRSRLDALVATSPATRVHLLGLSGLSAASLNQQHSQRNHSLGVTGHSRMIPCA